MHNSEGLELMKQALESLSKALSLLDEADAPADIGAHVDLARERLCRTLEAMHTNYPMGLTVFPKAIG